MAKSSKRTGSAIVWVCNNWLGKQSWTWLLLPHVNSMCVEFNSAQTTAVFLMNPVFFYLKIQWKDRRCIRQLQKCISWLQQPNWLPTTKTQVVRGNVKREKNGYRKMDWRRLRSWKYWQYFFKSPLKILTQKPCSFALLVLVCFWGWGGYSVLQGKKRKAMPYTKSRT